LIFLVISVSDILRFMKNTAYGLIDWNRHQIKEAQVIAVPGCNPTCVSLGLAPLAEAAVPSDLKKVHDNDFFVITSVIDNLLKGAGGQAQQNFNLMHGFSESLGLPSAPLKD
jgi:N-acetyl-gamma-glutamylphosphate reductase